jgi:hypothetical protein
VVSKETGKLAPLTVPPRLLRTCAGAQQQQQQQQQQHKDRGAPAAPRLPGYKITFGRG